MIDWSTADVTCLNGVGPKLKQKLLRLGIERAEQLLFHLPLRYEDRTRLSPIGGLQNGQRALIEGDILLTSVSFRRRRMLQVRVADGSGMINLRFFHFNQQQQQQLKKGLMIRCYGEARLVKGGLEMVHPEYRVFDQDRVPELEDTLTPIYPTTDGLHQLGLRKLMRQLLSLLEQFPLIETLPESWLQQRQLPRVNDALLRLHHPIDRQDVKQIQGMNHPAQQRFIIEELTAHRISLLQRRHEIRQMPCVRVSTKTQLHKRLLQQLPFTLTAAQQQVIEILMQDLQQDKPMMRLIQGDVGSGKTVVAAFAVLPLIEDGYQCALMAPTEILAEQHYQNFSHWFSALDIEVTLLTGSHKGKQRQHRLDSIESGEARLVIGTHALFQDSVKFHSLGLIIIDEQHRFGVAQRQALQKKAIDGLMPHQLIMTATPIPRTLAMSLYADLDYAQIDELPPGRTPVKTAIVGESSRDELIERVRKACAEGGQLYWVCTLIEESESLQCEAAERTFESLQQQLPDIHIGLVHGRMKSEHKEALIQSFKAGDIQLLVSTTVIEVGVDVPNANIMIIENPERLGLSQIHQLRGRVGRGVRESYCLLLVKNDLSQQASQRLEIIRNYQDGFVIAEKDLEIRGAGEVLGTRQAGDASFRIVDLVRDRRYFTRAVELAELLMQDQYQEQRQQLLDNWIGVRQGYSDVA